MDDKDWPKTPDQVDNIVSAELPPSPFEERITEGEKARRKPLWDIVLTNMIHGPCGTINPQCPCMDNGTCTKNFSKGFRSRTTVDPQTSHPMYQRCSPNEGGGSTVKDGKTIDNSQVVPFNAYFRYNCHINVEVCIDAFASKYLYKFGTKGPD